MVFPTPVGMVRNWLALVLMMMGFPHARGDGPTIRIALSSSKRFSPRPWGWSAKAQKTRRINNVFPTPVGMVRRGNVSTLPNDGFPHARGDGPVKGAVSR